MLDDIQIVSNFSYQKYGQNLSLIIYINLFMFLNGKWSKTIIDSEFNPTLECWIICKLISKIYKSTILLKGVSSVPSTSQLNRSKLKVIAHSFSIFMSSYPNFEG